MNLKEEIDKELGVIYQPERIMLGDLYVSENKYEFPEEMILGKEFPSFVKHCVADCNAQGFHVISVELRKITEQDIFHTSRTLIIKVAKLPKPDLSKLGIK